MRRHRLLEVAEYNVQTTNCCSRLFFCWLNPLLSLGKRGSITPTELTEPSPVTHDISTLVDQLQLAVDEQTTLTGRGSIASAYKQTNIANQLKRIWLLKLINLLLLLSFPIALCLLLNISHQSSRFYLPYIVCAVGLFLFPILQCLCSHHINSRTSSAKLTFQSAVGYIVIRKSLSMSPGIQKNYSKAELIDLMQCSQPLSEWLTQRTNMTVWIPLQLSICAGLLLYFLGGIPTAVGIVSLLLLIPIYKWLPPWHEHKMYYTRSCQNERSRVMDEVLRNIKLLKLFCWEVPFTSRISRVRQFELRALRQAQWGGALSLVITELAPTLVIVATIVTYYFAVDTLRPEEVFPSIIVFTIMKSPITSIPWWLQNRSSARIAESRLLQFMLEDEVDHNVHATSSALIEEQGYSIVFNNASFAFLDVMEAVAKIHNVTFAIPRGSLVCIVGPKNSGKTGLLQAVLGEMHKQHGTLDVRGSIAYCAARPWIMNTTVVQNITNPAGDPELSDMPEGEMGYDSELTRFRQILRDCELAFINKDMPLGDGGCKLTNTQKKCLGLARALWRNADVYLLDEVLQSTNKVIVDRLVENCILGDVMRGKTRLLVTSNEAVLAQADHIVVMKEGGIAHVGTYKQLTELGVALVYDTTSKTAKSLFSNAPGMYYGGASGSVNLTASTSFDAQSLPATPLLISQQQSSAVIDDDEQQPEFDEMDISYNAPVVVDVVTSNTYRSFFRSWGVCAMAWILFLHLLHQFAAFTGYVVLAVWTNREWILDEELEDYVNEEIGKLGKFRMQGEGMEFGPSVVEMVAPSGNMMHQPVVPIPEIPNPFLYEFLFQKRPSHTFFITYIVMGISCVATHFIVGYIARRHALKVASSYHSKMVDAVLHAPLQYYHSSPLRRIMQRFSQDQSTLDTVIPENLSELVLCILEVVFIYALLPFLFPGFGFLVVPFSLYYIYISGWYHKTVVQVVRLKPPSVVQYFTSILEGLATIRCHSYQDHILNVTHFRLWSLLSHEWLQQTLKRWLELRIDLLCSIIILCLSCLSVLFNVHPSYVGVGIIVTVKLSALWRWLTKLNVSLANNMVSVQHALDIMDAPCEAQWRVEACVKPDWPSHGFVVFRDVCLRYKDDGPQVLRDVTFTANATQKIAFVGDKGSSGVDKITECLLRLTEITSGSILIDGTDITKLGLHDLREHIGVIPYEARLVEGDLISNLDVHSQFEEQQVIAALKEVGMYELVQGLENELYVSITAQCTLFTAGQRQLLHLARILLLKPKVIIWEETVSQSDTNQAELQAMDKVIQRYFGGSTLLTVCKRKSSMLSADAVMIMENGSIAESGAPETLVQQNNSAFQAALQQGA